MGIYDRDWMRHRDEEKPSPSGPVLKPQPPSPRTLLVRCVILAVLIIIGLTISRQIRAGKNMDRDEPQYIPTSEDEITIATDDRPPPKLLRPVNVNTAPLEDLKSIPGMAENVARAIIAKRPFHSLEELTQVPGIKDKKLLLLRPYITITNPP